MPTRIPHILSFLAALVATSFVTTAGAARGTNIQLNGLIVSNDFIYSKEIENLSEETVTSCFDIFYPVDLAEKKDPVANIEDVETESASNKIPEKTALKLTDLLDIAFKKNRLIEVVKQQQEQSEGQLVQARSGYLPQLSLEGRYSYIEREESAGSTGDVNVETDLVEEDDVFYGGARLSQLLYDFGKTSSAIKVGKANLLASNARLHRQVQEVIFRVKEAYYNTLEKKLLIDVAAESVKSFEQHLQRAKVYKKAGIRTKIDVINAEVELSNARMALLGAEYDFKKARVALEQVLGVQPQGGEYLLYREDVRIDNILESMPPVPRTLETLVNEAMELRPDMVQLQLLTRASEENMKSSRGEYWPSVSAQANYNNYDTDLSLYKDSWEVGVAATWDLFSGLNTRGVNREARAQYQENRARLEDLRLVVVREVTEGYLGAVEKEERVKIALETLELAKENVALAEKRYESGANDVLEFNDAQLVLTQTRQDLVATYYGYLTALAGIEFASGRLFE